MQAPIPSAGSITLNKVVKSYPQEVNICREGCGRKARLLNKSCSVIFVCM